MKIDWIGTVFGISGALSVIIDVRLATVIWIISNIAFIVWAVRTNVKSIAVLQVVYLIINSITLVVRWYNP